MTIKLYDASVANYLQILDAASGVLARAKAHFDETGVDLEEIVETSLIADMRPLRFQVQQLAFHSVGALEAIKAGVLTMPGPRPSHSYVELQGLIDEARTSLLALTPDAVEAWAGGEVVFQVGDTRRLFTTEGFLLSFSLPNFYFHATTAYDILRSRGAPIGKRDFMGELRLKT